MNKELVLDRIQILCTKKGVSLNTAFIESGVGKNFKSNMKIANPSIGKLTMLANYFGVPVSLLVDENADVAAMTAPSTIIRGPLTAHEREVISAYRARPEMQIAVDRLLGIDSDGEIPVYIAACSDDNHPDKIIRISREQWERIKDAPETDDTLL